MRTDVSYHKDRPAAVGEGESMHDITACAQRRTVHSQNGEDGIIAHVLGQVGTTNRHAFEIGSDDGINNSNTRALWYDGWIVHLADANPNLVGKIVERAEGRVLSAVAKVDRHSIDDVLIRMLECPAEPDFGVLDIDGQECHVVKGMKRCRPRVFMVECAAGVCDDWEPPEGGDGQAGPDVLIRVLRPCGYVPVWRNDINILCVREDVLKEWEAAQ